MSPCFARDVTILGTGHALPRTAIESVVLDRQLGLPLGTIERAGGVRKRYFAEIGETAAGLAAQAAHRALEAAGLGLHDIDCLIAASGTMDQGMPCNAALIHRELELSDRAIPAFDINASCLGFLAAIDTMAWPIAAGRFNRVLIVAADLASCGLDWGTLEASAVFGDGAAAAVVGRQQTGTSRLLATDMKTLSCGADLCCIPAGGSRHHPSRIDVPFGPLTTFHMDGKGVFRLASQHIPAFVEGLLEQAGLVRDQLDWIVPHQASQLALTHLTRRLGFRPERVIDVFAEHGNQVAASLPTALDIAVRDGRIQRGQNILLIGTGAGLSLGGVVLEF